MNIKDIKNYRGYIPMIFEEQKIISFLLNLIGNDLHSYLWFNKFNDRYIIRYRFGNKNVAQIYLKNKSWLNVPLPIWINLSSLNKNQINNDSWNWINNQKLYFNINNKKIKINNKNNNIYDI